MGGLFWDVLRFAFFLLRVDLDGWWVRGWMIPGAGISSSFPLLCFALLCFTATLLHCFSAPSYNVA